MGVGFYILSTQISLDCAFKFLKYPYYLFYWHENNTNLGSILVLNNFLDGQKLCDVKHFKTLKKKKKLVEHYESSW